MPSSNESLLQMDTDTVLQVNGLKTHFTTNQGVVKAVDGVSFTAQRGQTLCIVGESGCGKSITARSILQLIDKPGRIVDGNIFFRSASGQVVDLAKMPPRGSEIRTIRGKEISMIFQEPMTSLSPVHTIGNQIMEVLLLHTTHNKKEARDRAIESLQQVGMPKPQQTLDYYPFQLSGGMRQRAMIAMALACEPSVLIADEPTTALDVTTQAVILDLIHDLQARLKMSVLFITHDLGVVAEIANQVAVMYLGTVVEQGSVDDLFHNPQHPYTRALLRSIPRLGASARGNRQLETIRGMVPSPYHRPNGCPFHPRCDQAIKGVCDSADAPDVAISEQHRVRCFLHAPNVTLPTTIPIMPRVAESASPSPKSPQLPARPLLEVRHIKMHFPIQKGIFKRTVGFVRAVDDVSFDVYQGETLGLVGESGCGKTTLGRCILRIYAPTDGEMHYYHPEDTHATNAPSVDLARLSRAELKPYRKDIRMIFQDPYSSLNPRFTVSEIIGESLRINANMSGKALEDRVAELLQKVGLRPEYMHRYPHAFSGGERQRIGIARALALNPRLVVADESVSALDVSVQAQTLNLLESLRQELGLTFIFVAHNLSVVEHISDRVAVMYVGKIVELAPTHRLYSTPKHPYTEALMSAVPNPDPDARQHKARIRLEGEVADPSHPPSGCYFHPRCRYAQERCRLETPALRDVGDGHLAACHFAESLALNGVNINEIGVSSIP